MADLNLPEQLSLPAWFEVTGNKDSHQQNIKAMLLDTMAKQSFRERWKYTRPQRVLDLLGSQSAQQDINLTFAEGVQARQILPGQASAPLQASDFDHALQNAPEAIAALCGSHAVLLLDIHQSPAQPVVLNTLSSPLILIRVAANVKVELEQSTNARPDDEFQCVWLQLANGSQAVHGRNNLHPADCAARSFKHLQVDIAADAGYTLHNHSVGCATHRQNIHINCAGSGASASIKSAAFAPPGTHLDQQITVEHSAAHSYSEQTIHNIAADKANVTFNGRIHIHKHSNGVQAHLTNKNLGIGGQATINTKPELEIYTDDVQCSHGATVGQLDDGHVFYCASRGINSATAKRLLSQAFLRVCTSGSLAQPAQLAFAELADGAT